MSVWKVGDVAMVTALNRKTPYRATWDGKVWVEYDRPFSHLVSADTARPLVVIDPEDAEQINGLVSAFSEANLSRPIPSDMQAALREYASPTPPKPEEPQRLGAVVEASCVHSSRRHRWIRGFDGNWWSENRLTYNAPGGDTSQPDDWGSLIDPVLSEGVTA